MSEVEVIQYNQINGMYAFFNNVAYRAAHLHPEWELIWIIENSMRINCDGTSFLARKDDLILFSPSHVHEFKKVDKSCTFLCLQVSPSFLNLKNSVVSSSVHPKEFLSPSDLAYIRATLISMMKHYIAQDSLYQIYCVGECSLVMHRLLSKMPLTMLSDEENHLLTKKNARLARFIAYVDANYTRKIRLGDFAKAEGISLCYLSHFIRDALNQSFLEYINTVRFNHACALIADNNMKMSEIYKASGFSDYKYFAKTFLEQCGKTPDEYSRDLSRNVRASHSKVRLGTIENIFSREQSKGLIERLIQEERWK